MMPMQRNLYPPDWEEIASVKKQNGGWKCEVCGKQCRKPGEPFDTHRNTLTVAHLDHDPANCADDNLKAMCAPCHLRYDAHHHAETRRKKHHALRSQMNSAAEMLQEMLDVDRQQGEDVQGG